MKIAFLGTSDFSLTVLQSLLQSKHQVVCVVTNVDKVSGRGHKVVSPIVKTFAIQNNIPVLQYNKVSLEGYDQIKSYNPDVLVTASFGQILKQNILDLAPYGVINVHSSLLPKYRGASPINYAILNGEKVTGITVMKTDVGIDTGDMIYKKEISIGEEETAGELFSRLSVLGAECIEKVVLDLLKGELPLEKQDENKATYTKIIKKELAKIDSNKSAEEIVNQIRAFNPSPVAYAYLNDEPFKIYKAKATNESGEAGKVIVSDKRLVIACIKGAIELLKVQKCGGKTLEIKDFILGNKLPLGTEFK
jgi:methionyl-tRNA formyltransferase